MKKKNRWLGREITYMFLAPFLVLLGILAYGILFDKWFKDPMFILQASGFCYAAIILIRIFRWIIRKI